VTRRYLTGGSPGRARTAKAATIDAKQSLMPAADRDVLE
jgi:hypothetical protein